MSVERLPPASLLLVHGAGSGPWVYDGWADEFASMPGARRRPSRGERKRGISVPSLRCASLVVYGDDFREERGLAIARLYGSRERYIPGLDHWGVVQDRRVREAIAEFLAIPRSDALLR